MADVVVPSRQEMFDRAWSGLKGQGFMRAVNSGVFGGSCTYLALDGKRCAWGHVDTSLTDELGGVTGLHERGIGLAKFLDNGDLLFATALQVSHDSGNTPKKMELSLRDVAERYGLTVPE